MPKRNTKFAERLKELRDEAGVSMAELAKAVGVSDAAVCKWENGAAEPKASYIVKLADYFDCSIEYLLGVESYHKTASRPIGIKVTDGKGNTVKGMPPDIVTVTTDERIVVDSYKMLTPDMKALFKSTLETWISNGESKNKAKNEE